MGLALLIHNDGITDKNTTLPCPIKKRKAIERLTAAFITV